MAKKNGRKNGRRSEYKKFAAALNKEQFILGRTRVRSWDAWLVIILMLGIFTGIISTVDGFEGSKIAGNILDGILGNLIETIF